MGVTVSVQKSSNSSIRLALLGLAALILVVAIGAGRAATQPADKCAKERDAIDALDAALPGVKPSVRCENGVVITITLSNLGLLRLPSQIGAFPNLTTLYLDGNGFASIPGSIGKLTKLKSLYLDDNRLVSVTPEIGKLTQLETLSLSENFFAVVPDIIGNLTNLKEVDFTDNDIDQIPSTIENLKKLETLALGQNRLKLLPVQMGGLTSLRSLDLSSNSLLDVSSGVLSLPSLETLNLRENPLRRLLPGVGRLVNLKTLDLSNNALTTLPGGLENLTKFETLVADNNQIGSLPSQLFTRTSLTRLSLSGNQLQTVSSDVGNLVNLKELRLNKNQIADIPKEIGNLKRLEVLTLDSNKLTTVPAEVGSLSRLKTLSLGSNELTSLPVQVGRVSSAFSTDDTSLYNNSGLSFPYIAIGECNGGSPLLLVVARKTAVTVSVNNVKYDLPLVQGKPQSLTLAGAGTGPEFSVTYAGESQQVRCQDGGGGTGDGTLKDEVSVARSCLAGNGRVDFNIVNSQSDARYRIEFEGLSARGRSVAGSEAWRMPYTGRRDGTYAVTISKTLLIDQTTEAITLDISIDCDRPTPVELSEEIDVIPYCVAGRGFVRYQFVNPTSADRSYIISFQGLSANRSTTARAYGASVSGISARPNGTYSTTVEYGNDRGTPVYSGTVTIDCQPIQTQ